MDSQPNPFADEPLPIKGPRLESGASPDNPYAAPVSAEAYHPVPEPGVGLWRDGPLLVMHLQAPFPNRCLITGEESQQRRKQSVRWYYPIDISTRTLKVEYAVSSEAQRRINWRRTAGFAVASCTGLLIAVCAMQPEVLFPILGGWGVFACLIAIVVGLHHGLHGGKILTFRKVKYPYLWLHGAQEPFLSKLPQWPGVSG